jgi:hypothetical protein
LANAWENQDIQSIRKNSSLDFNRLVWSNLPAVPEEYEALPELLRMPVQRTQSTEQRARIELASAGQPPVTVLLLKENTSWVIDEVSIKQPDGTQLELRKTLRQVIAQQFLNDPTGEFSKLGLMTKRKLTEELSEPWEAALRKTSGKSDAAVLWKAKGDSDRRAATRRSRPH